MKTREAASQVTILIEQSRFGPFRFYKRRLVLPNGEYLKELGVEIAGVALWVQPPAKQFS